MRDDKYFYPEIEDIFVGYECESTSNEERWYKWKFEQHNFPALDLEILNNMYRTPYLTQEQIENEGWEIIAVYRDGGTTIFSFKGTKFLYELTYKGQQHLTPSNKVIITEIRETVDRPVRDNIYKGECKDINTFRKILKLLNI